MRANDASPTIDRAACSRTVAQRDAQAEVTRERASERHVPLTMPKRFMYEEWKRLDDPPSLLERAVAFFFTR